MGVETAKGEIEVRFPLQMESTSLYLGKEPRLLHCFLFT